MAASSIYCCILIWCCSVVNNFQVIVTVSSSTLSLPPCCLSNHHWENMESSMEIIITMTMHANNWYCHDCVLLRVTNRSPSKHMGSPYWSLAAGRYVGAYFRRIVLCLGFTEIANRAKTVLCRVLPRRKSLCCYTWASGARPPRESIGARIPHHMNTHLNNSSLCTRHRPLDASGVCLGLKFDGDLTEIPAEHKWCYHNAPPSNPVLPQHRGVSVPSLLLYLKRQGT